MFWPEKQFILACLVDTPPPTWDNFRSGATDVSDEYDNVCVYAHIKYIVAAMASVYTAK